MQKNIERFKGDLCDQINRLTAADLYKLCTILDDKGYEIPLENPAGCELCVSMFGSCNPIECEDRFYKLCEM